MAQVYWWHWLGLACATVTLGLTLGVLFQLSALNPRPAIAKFYVRIVLMPVVFALSAALTLFWLREALFISILRYIFEAYVVYLYVLLLLAFVGGEQKVWIARTTQHDATRQGD
jgi:hypothetical protein